MQQSLHLLQAPVQELRTLVQQELVSNPVLEETQNEPEEREEEEFDSEASEIEREDEYWRDYFSQNRQSGGNIREMQERRQFLFDSQIEQETLSDHLLSQLTLSSGNEEFLRAGEEIIGNINEDGFFSATLEDICGATRVSPETAASALALIQTFHPPGIGARNLQETLLIQLNQRGKGQSLETELVRDCLNDLARKRFSDLARKYKVTPERIQEAANYIAQLQPRPGASFSPELPQNVVQPEAAFVKIGDNWLIQLNDEPVPRLRISDRYKDLLGTNGSETGLRDYLKERIRAAKFLIKCLQQRQQTIQRILEEIAVRQHDFLEGGVAHLKPLTMNQVAEVVGVHETTVSRAIANKYVETPWGVFPIKFFFTAGYQTNEGETLSNTSVKEAINDLVSREDRSKPLSDSEIVQILSEQGINLARRTVAKYRAELNILPSNLRRVI